MKELKKKYGYTFMLLILAAIVILFFTVMKGKNFWQVSLWQGMMAQFPEYGIMTLGLMFCFICGKMDMSFMMLGNFATVMAVRYIIANTTDTMNNGQIGGVMLVGILIALAIAIVGGIINGLLVTQLNIPPVMATISMQMVWLGISTALTRGDTVTGLPTLYTEIGHTNLFGWLPLPMLIFIILFIICAFVLKYTVYGEKIYMIGTNEKAAKFSGIDTTKTIIITYVLCDVLATIGALIMVSTMASAKADYGTSYVTRAILILVLAGVLPNGGMGKILNVLITIFTIQIIATGVNLFPKLNTYYASLIWGGLLVIVLILSTKMTDEGLILFKKKNKEQKGRRLFKND